MLRLHPTGRPKLPLHHLRPRHSPKWAASTSSSLIPIQPNNTTGDAPPPQWQEKKKHRQRQWVLDPRSQQVQHWSRGLLLTRVVAPALDQLFFYALSIGGRNAPPCLVMDGGLVTVVMVMRTTVDVAHIAHMWLQMRLAYVSRESLVVDCGKLVWDARTVAESYLRSAKGFWFDLFVILPVP